MINPKNISISAAIGFFLSFFIGLVSDVRFSHVLLRALLFAVVFGALCVGITFIYQKFLTGESNSFGVEGEPSPQKTAGGVVNIVVDDSMLADDGMAPRFTVLNNHISAPAASSAEPSSSPSAESQSASAPESSAVSAVSASLQEPSPEVSAQVAEPVQSASAPSEAAPSQESSFKPASLDSVTQSPSPTTSATGTADSPSSAQPSSSAAESATEQLDELPDIGSMDSSVEASAASDLDSDSGASEIVTDTEFSTGGGHLKEQPISGDTNVMAKAIQTLLAKDND